MPNVPRPRTRSLWMPLLCVSGFVIVGSLSIFQGDESVSVADNVAWLRNLQKEAIAPPAAKAPKVKDDTAPKAKPPVEDVADAAFVAEVAAADAATAPEEAVTATDASPGVEVVVADTPVDAAPEAVEQDATGEAVAAAAPDAAEAVTPDTTEEAPLDAAPDAAPDGEQEVATDTEAGDAEAKYIVPPTTTVTPVRGPPPALIASLTATDPPAAAVPPAAGAPPAAATAPPLILPHKALFPLDSRDIAGIICTILGLLVAAMAGLGGGGILIPIYILVFGFPTKSAIPLSSVTVLGVGIAHGIVNVHRRHPQADRPLIAWDLLLGLEPMTIAGALIGAIFNKILPALVITILLVCVLGFTAYKSLTKALKLFEKENKKIQEEKMRRAGVLLEKKEDVKDEKKLDEEKGQDEAVAESPELRRLLERERTAPTHYIVLLVALFAVVLLVNIMKGGGSFASPVGIVCGGVSFWVANLFMLIWITCMFNVGRNMLMKDYETKVRLGYKFYDGDIKWDRSALTIYPALSVLAGFFSAMFGIGGGLITSPLMLTMGVNPTVTASVSATMVLFTATTAVTSFVVFGLLIEDYAFFLFAIGFFSTVVGKKMATAVMQHFNRNSFVAFAIGAVVALSAFLMTIQSLTTITQGSSLAPGALCA